MARYNRAGLSGLETKAGRGRKPLLTPQEAEQLRQRLDAGPLPDDGVSALRGKDVQRILQHEFGRLRSSVAHSWRRPKPGIQGGPDLVRHVLCGIVFPPTVQKFDEHLLESAPQA